MGLELLGQRTYDQISITELARNAGISKGLLYHYFPTKSDFVVAVLRRSREDLLERMSFDASLEPTARLDAALEAWLAYVEEHAAGFQALVRARHGDDDAIIAELAEERRMRLARLTDFAAALADADRATLATPALEAILCGWLSFTENVVLRWLSHREFDRDQVRRLLRHALFAALASVAVVDDTAAAARLAEAAQRAASVPVLSAA
jgi:AcrR family transcriptional regulator